jgi:hypothetical protein
MYHPILAFPSLVINPVEEEAQIQRDSNPSNNTVNDSNKTSKPISPPLYPTSCQDSRGWAVAPDAFWRDSLVSLATIAVTISASLAPR